MKKMVLAFISFLMITNVFATITIKEGVDYKLIPSSSIKKSNKINIKEFFSFLILISSSFYILIMK